MRLSSGIGVPDTHKHNRFLIAIKPVDAKPVGGPAWVVFIRPLNEKGFLWVAMAYSRPSTILNGIST